MFFSVAGHKRMDVFFGKTHFCVLKSILLKHIMHKKVFFSVAERRFRSFWIKHLHALFSVWHISRGIRQNVRKVLILAVLYVAPA